VKRWLMQACAICVLASVGFLAQIAPGVADGWDQQHHYRHHAHVAYVDYLPDYSACRTGWWQTLRYGHVRPVWGTWCR
jgi:hypothetical protein